jgi:hypothetical protein
MGWVRTGVEIFMAVTVAGKEDTRQKGENVAAIKKPNLNLVIHFRWKTAKEKTFFYFLLFQLLEKGGTQKQP